MNVEINTSEPEKVDPAKVAKVLEDAGYFVLTVDVNDGERYWRNEILSDGGSVAFLALFAVLAVPFVWFVALVAGSVVGIAS